MLRVAALNVRRLVMTGWRNLEPAEWLPGERFNVIHGDNGAGKSNLLEAIDYLAALQSFRGARSAELIALNAQHAQLEGEVTQGSLPRRLSVRLDRNAARQLKLDGKRPSSAAQWHRAVQAVSFHPGDVELPRGAPEQRRAFLDHALQQIDATFSSSLSSYQRALRSRNRLLKRSPGATAAIRAFDEVLSSAGAIVGRARQSIVQDLVPRARDVFHELSGQDDILSLAYRPRVEPDPTALRRALEGSLSKDQARGFTGPGPHGDDLSIELQGARAKSVASQGQQRAVVLALKISLLELLRRRTGQTPLLLLDDVSSELDRSRNRRLFRVLSEVGSQVFLTTTHPEFILLEEARKDFHIERGKLAR